METSHTPSKRGSMLDLSLIGSENMENSYPQSKRGSMLDMSLTGYSTGDPTRTSSRSSQIQLDNFGIRIHPRPQNDPGRSIYSWMYDKPMPLPPVKRKPRYRSSLGYILEERPDSGLGRDALLNRQQRYEFWADQIQREEENIKKAQEEKALTGALDESRMTKAEKRQSASMLQEAERAIKEAQEKGTAPDPDKDAMTRRQQHFMYQSMAKQFSEIIAMMDANSPMLKDAVFRGYLYLLCDSDDLIVHERKTMEKTKKEIQMKRYELHYILYELHQEEQEAGREAREEFEMSSARLRGKPLGVSIREISAGLQVDSESEEGEEE